MWDRFLSHNVLLWIENIRSNLPAARRNVSPVKSPGDDGSWHPHSLTRERHCCPSCCLNRLLWWACHRWRGCAVSRRWEVFLPHNKCTCTKKAGMWLEFGDPVKLINAWRSTETYCNSLQRTNNSLSVLRNGCLTKSSVSQPEHVWKRASSQKISHRAQKNPEGDRGGESKQQRGCEEREGGGMSNRELQTAVGVRLTAAVLIRAVRAVGLVVTLVAGWDAGAIAQAFKLLRSTPVARTLRGCCSDRIEIYVNN